MYIPKKKIKKSSNVQTYTTTIEDQSILHTPLSYRSMGIEYEKKKGKEMKIKAF